MLGLVSDMEIDHAVVWKGTQAELVVQDVVPLEFYNIVSRCRDSEALQTSEERGSKDQEPALATRLPCSRMPDSSLVRGDGQRVRGCLGSRAEYLEGQDRDVILLRELDDDFIRAGVLCGRGGQCISVEDKYDLVVGGVGENSVVGE